MTKAKARWTLAAVTLLAFAASVVIYGWDSRELAVAVLAVLLMEAVVMYLIEKHIPSSTHQHE